MPDAQWDEVLASSGIEERRRTVSDIKITLPAIPTEYRTRSGEVKKTQDGCKNEADAAEYMAQESTGVRYRVTATRIDGNGVQVWSRNAETTGDLLNKTFATRVEAEEAAEAAQDEAEEYDMADAEYSTEEI